MRKKVKSLAQEAANCDSEIHKLQVYNVLLKLLRTNLVLILLFFYFLEFLTVSIKTITMEEILILPRFSKDSYIV